MAYATITLYKEPSDHEQFGIWATIRHTDSDLNEFGVQVTRTLIVDSVRFYRRKPSSGSR